MPAAPTLQTTVLGTALVLAPALMGAALLVDITPEADTTQELLLLIDEKPNAWALGQLLFFLAAIAWAPAALGLVRLFRGRSRVGQVAAVAVGVGGLAVLPVDAAGLYLRQLAGSDIPLGQQVELVEAVEGSATVLTFEIVHLVGLFAGLLAVAVVMLLGRGVPRWAGGLVLLGLVGMVAAPGRPLLAVAVLLLTAGFVVAAAQLLGAPGRDSEPTTSGTLTEVGPR